MPIICHYASYYAIKKKKYKDYLKSATNIDAD